jgi:hypothetical protein
MSVHVVQLTVEVDDEALAEWPYTKNMDEWDASDVFRAAEQCIIDPGECDYTYLGKATG